MVEVNQPFEEFAKLVAGVCGQAEQPNLANRAKLRRTLRSTDRLATPEVLSLIGAGIGERDTRRIINLKAGIAALYAAHGKPRRSHPWTTPAQLLGEASRSQDISADRAGRELLGLLRETDPAALIRRCHRALTLCRRADAPARIDWARLLADLSALTGDDRDRRSKVEDRWARDYAKIPQSDLPPAVKETAE